MCNGRVMPEVGDRGKTGRWKSPRGLMKDSQLPFAWFAKCLAFCSTIFYLFVFFVAWYQRGKTPHGILKIKKFIKTFTVFLRYLQICLYYYNYNLLIALCNHFSTFIFLCTTNIKCTEMLNNNLQSTGTMLFGRVSCK